MIEEEVFAFARTTIGSVWTLQVLVALQSEPDRKWEPDDLNAKLRANPVIVTNSLHTLVKAGLVAETRPGTFVYYPKSEAIADLAERFVRTFAERPIAIIEAIYPPYGRLQSLSDAFLFRGRPK